MAKTYNQIKNSVLGKDYDIKRKKDNQPKTYAEIKAGVKEGKYNFTRVKEELENTIRFDTFATDLSSMGKAIEDSQTNWQTPETLNTTRSSAESMQGRLQAYKEYQRLFGGKDNKGIKELEDLQSGIRQTLGGWDDLSKVYGQYKTADAYNKEKDTLTSLYSMPSSEIKTKMDSNFDDIYKAAEGYNKQIEDISNSLSNIRGDVRGNTAIQDAIKRRDSLIAERDTYLKSVGYSSMDELNKAKSGVAYTTSDGYNIKWQDLYNDAYLREYTQEIKKTPDFANTTSYKKKDVTYTTTYSGHMVVSDEDAHLYNYINGDKEAKDYGELVNVHMSGTSDSLKNLYLNNEEKQIFNSLWETQGPEKAKEYLGLLDSDLRQRRVEHEREYNSQIAKESPIGASVASVIQNVGNNAMALPFLAMDFADGDGIDPNSSLYTGRRAVQTTRSTIENDVIDSDIGKFFYRHGMNIADNLASRAVALGMGTGAASQFLMSSGAAVDTVLDAKERGLSDGQALSLGAISGAAEWYFESKGFESWVDRKTLSKSAWEYFTNNLKTELVGEIFTEGTNDIADYFIAQDLNKLNTEYQSYIASGLSEKEAFLKVTKGVASRYADVAAGTILSTGVMAGPGATIGGIQQHSINKTTGQNIKANERVADVFDIASNPEVASAYDAYTRYAKKGINAENISDAKLGRLYSMTRAEAQAVLESETSTEEQRQSALKTLARLSVVGTENTVAKEKKNLNIGEETKVTDSGESVNVKDLKIKGDEVIFATEKGDVSVDDITLSDVDADLVAYARAISKTDGEDVANLFVSQYDGKTDIDAYANDFNLTMAYAKNNFTYDTILNKKGVLSTEQVNDIYRETRIKADKERAEAIKKLNKEMADKNFYKGIIDDSVIDYENTSAEGKVNWNDLDSRQRQAITFVKGFAQATGMNLNLITNGLELGINGAYDVSGNTITLDIYAGIDHVDNLKDTIIPTMSHETTHWMKEKAPELWRNLNEIVFSTLTEHYNSNTEQAIKDKIALLDMLDPRVKHTEEDAKGRAITEEDLIRAEMNRKGKSADVSREEIIARACEDMLKMSEQGKKMFFSLSEDEQKTLVGKIKSLINDLLNWVNDFLNSYEATSTEARIMREYKEQLQKASKVWDEMLKKSVEANQSLEKSGAFKHDNVSDGDVRFQTRSVNGNEVVWIEENILKENKGQPIHQFIADFIAEHIGDVYTLIESGQKVYIGEDLPGEYTQSKYTQKVLAKNPNIIKAKNKVAANIKEIIEIAANRRWEKTEHPESKDAKYGMYRYDTRFGFPVKNTKGDVVSANIYKAELVIRNASDGRKYLYDIVEIKKDTVSSDWMSKKISSAAEKSAGQKNNVSNNSISNSKPNVNTKFSDNEDMRFSMRENVEETRDLIAVHNMQVSELERTLDLGGLPMPSIAIIKAKSGHSEYGDVSLVFPKSTIDPKADKNNKVYGGDAWTPTYPTIEYKPSEKVSKKINDKYYEFSRKYGYDESRPLYNYVYDMEDILNRHKGEAEMIAELYEDEKMMQVYLLDTGKDKIETIQKEVRTELTDAEVEMNDFFISELGADVVDEVMWDGNGTPMSYRKNYLSKYEDAIRDAYKKLLSEKYHFTDEQVQNVMDSTKNADLIRFVRDAHKYRENGRVTTRTEADYEATKEAIKTAAGEGYRKWIDSLFKGIEEKSGIRNNTDYFTNSGNRRSWEALHWENNLENVIKVMKSQDNGVAALFSGHAIWAVSAKDYRSIEEIKADADRLKQLPEEEYNKIKEGFGERFQEIAHSIMSKTESNPFIASDNAMSCIVEAVRNSKTKSGLLKNLKEYTQLTVTETTVEDIISLVADISNMPTEYFEAKPQRAVELNEIATAIIPDTTSEATKTRLGDMGIKYLEYESGNEESRLNALNSLEDVRFSERDDIGYHAGDLGKAESLGSQGYDRDTGHFGRGTYFVGNKELVKDYNKRDGVPAPQHAVDFSNYNLYKVKNDKDGYELHNQLRIIDGGLNAEWVEAAKADKVFLYRGTEYYRIAEEKFGEKDKYTNKAIIYGLTELARKANIDIPSMEQYSVESGYALTEDYFEDIYSDYLKEFVGEKIDAINEEYAKYRDAYFYLQMRFGFKGEVDEAMNKVLEYQNANRRDVMDAYKKDSLATVFMKALGYEGVDTRGTALDNTAYGSVIYDLKEDTILYSDRDNTSVYDIMGETERIKKENEKFKAEIERLRERLKLERQVTHGNYFNENQLGAVAGHLRNISKSNIDKLQLVDSLKDVYSFIANSPTLTWEDIFERCYRVAEDMIAEAKPEKVVDDYSKQILRNIKSKRISFSEMQKQEASHIFGKNWNRNFFGRTTLTDDGIPVENQWREWASMYPDIFDADITDTDMPGELYDIINTLQDASETVAEYDTEEQTRWLAREIYNQYWNVSPIRTTADKYDKQIKLLNFEHRRAMAEFREEYNSRLKEQHKADKEKYKKLVAEIRERKDKQIALAKEHGREMLSSYKENAERKTMIQSVLSTVTSLNKKLITNSKDVHIPESLKPVVQSLIDAIDFSSKQMLNKGIPTKADSELDNRFNKAKSMADGNTSLKQSIQDALELFEGAEKVANNTSDGTLDLSLVTLDADLIDSIKSMVKSIEVIEKSAGNKFVLQQMELNHLKTLNAMVKSINHWATKADQALASKHKERISQISEGTIAECEPLGERQEYIKAIEGLKKFFSWSNLLPVNAFKRLGKWGEKVFSFMQDAQDSLAFHQEEITNFTNKLFEGHDIQKWREDIKEFDLKLPNKETKKVRMPVSYIMSLYCVSKQEDARRHLYGVDEYGNIYENNGGGMTIKAFKEKKSLKVSKDIENTILSESLINQITSVLTAEQREIADKLQQFMNTKGSEWCDSVSLALYGIKKFDIENYFPITVTPTTIKVLDPQDKRQSVHFFSILNYGFTKSRNPHAKQSIEISDIFEVFSNHMSMAAIYSSYALPIYDVVRWFNYKGKDVNGKEIGVNKSIQKAFGEAATTYIGRLISDLNGQHESSRLGFISKIFQNTKIAMVGNSISVALLQPTAYLKAMVKIPTRHLIKSVLYIKDFGASKGVEKAKKYCGIALWKSQGNFDTDISKGVSQKILHDETWVEKLKEWSLKGAGWMDERTWGVLWNACEFDVRASRKDLKVGSDEFYEVVANKLRGVIYETQVVDSPLTRSDLMRSPDTGAKMITMFASEITVAYNMVNEAFVDASLDVKKNGKKGAFKRNAKNIAMALTAYTLTSAVSQVFATAVSAFRDDEEKDFEELLKMYFTNLLADWVLIGKIPYIKETLNYAQGYSSTRVDTLWLDSAAKAVKYWARAFDGKDGAGEKAIKETLKSLSYLSGIPGYNQYRDLMATMDKLGILSAEDFSEMLDDIFD